MTAMRTWAFFLLVFNRGYACAMIVRAYTGRSFTVTQLLMRQFGILPSQYRHIGHLHIKKFDAEKIVLTKWQLNELKHVCSLFYWSYACVIIVHTQANQLQLQLLMDQLFDTSAFIIKSHLTFARKSLMPKFNYEQNRFMTILSWLCIAAEN